MSLLSKLTILVLTSIVFGTVLSSSVLAKQGGGASSWAETDQSRVRLVSASTTVGTGTVSLGLQFELKPDWKVYWRSPGDAGYPPSIDWKSSSNLKSAWLAWPIPTRFSVLGLETLGYKKQVLLPVYAEVISVGAALSLKAHVRYLTCNKICIPYEADLALRLPYGLPQSSPYAHRINLSASKVPGNGDVNGLKITTLKTWYRDGKTWLQISANARMEFSDPDVFVEGPPRLTYSKPAVQLSHGSKAADLYLSVKGLDVMGDNKEKSLAGTKFTVTLVNGDNATQLVMAASEIAPPANSPLIGQTKNLAAPSLALILVFALIGGFILNLMPCVLPVLSLKLLSVINHGGGTPRDVRVNFLASAAGIISTFLILAASLLILRSAGSVIGWGIQFQQPWFLTILVLIVTIFACNLWGFFDVSLPTTLSDFSQNAVKVNDFGGHFLQGAFATILATPCTAPFLGTAISFALAGSLFDILNVFLALGIGMALPYLGIAAFPALASQLPKPGPWILRLKIFLGILLAGTGVWLLYILTAVAGYTNAIAVGAIALAGVLLLFIAHRKNLGGFRLSVPGLFFLCTIALVVPLWIPSAFKVNGTLRLSSYLAEIWAPFEPTAIHQLVASGKTVFVDVTADWCITCQVNKSLVINDTDVLAGLSTSNVVAMQADWTRPDDEIARYLATFGRFGIPFNAIYGPNAPTGIILSELLTKTAILNALKNAGSRSGAKKDP